MRLKAHCPFFCLFVFKIFFFLLSPRKRIAKIERKLGIS